MYALISKTADLQVIKEQVVCQTSVLHKFVLLISWLRYLNMHLSSSLTVCWQGKPGGHLKAKLCDYLRPKCHPIFFDSNINSSAVVRLNIYQAFLLCAMKFHCYVCDLSNICKLDLKSYMCSIEKSLRYVVVDC